MIKNLLYIFLFTLALAGKAQVNLVPNPSFENYTACPDNCEFNFLNNWTNPTNYSPDFFQSCATNTDCGVPINYYGNQTAQNGNGYVGIITGCPPGCAPPPGVREYIQVMLTSSLQANIQYSLVMYVSIAESVKYLANSVGAHFSINSISSNDNYVLPYSPQVNFTTLNSNSSKTNWIVLTGSFVAQGGEKYLTIGNFLDDNTTVIDTFQNSGNPSSFSYLFIDNISLNPIVTSINERYANSQVSIMPTIVNDIIRVSFNEEIKMIKIISTCGLIISEEKFNSKDVVLIVPDLINGFYYLQIEHIRGKVQKKIIINR